MPSVVIARRTPLQIVRSAALPAIALFVIAHFAGFAIFGANGLLSLAGYRQQKSERLAELDALKAKRSQLEHHAALLDPAHVDPDYADEIVRRETRQVRPDEVILPTE